MQFEAARQFGDEMLGCREPDRSSGKTCLWGYAGANRYTRDTDRGDFRFRQDTGGRLRVGVDLPIGSTWTVGAAFGYDDLGTMRFDGSRAQADGKAGHAGIAVGKTFGAEDAGSAKIGLSGGVQSTDLTRRQTVFVSATGTSHFKTNYVGATGDVGYSFGEGIFFARPSLTGSMFRLGQSKFTERGLEGLGVTGTGGHSWIGTLSPRATVGAHIGKDASVSFNGGGIFHNRAAVSAPLRLIGANPEADPAIIRSRFDKNGWTAGTDLVLGGSGPWSVDLGYRGEYGKSVTSHSAHLKLKVAF